MPYSILAQTPGPSTRNGPNFDLNHPFFPHSSDAPGMSLVNDVFDGKGYQVLKRSVLIVVSAKNKLGFINRNCPAPTTTSKDFQPWSRCIDMVISWLLNYLSKDIENSVIYSKSARNLWISLKHKFGQSNGAKFVPPTKEISRFNSRDKLNYNLFHKTQATFGMN